MKNKRISWDEYFLDMLDSVSARATCDRGRTAVIIAIDNEIVVTGYVGSPSGIDHCDDIGHQMATVIDDSGKTSQHCVRTNHAEMNAIAQAAKNGKAIKGGTLYCKMTPCYTCAKMLVQVGMRRIVARERYHADKLSLEILRTAKVRVKILSQKVLKYPKGGNQAGYIR